MAIKNKALNGASIQAWDTESNLPSSGETISLQVMVNGSSAALSDTPFDMSASGMPGIYKFNLSASEMNGDYIVVAGSGATSTNVIYPLFIQTERGDIALNSGIINSRLPSTLIGGRMNSDIQAVSGDASSAQGLANTYNGIGFDNAVAPAQQQQIGSITLTGGALNTLATSGTLITGAQVGGTTWMNTLAKDEVYDQVEDTAGLMEKNYIFNVGGDGTPVGLEITGRINGSNDSLTVYAYNWNTTVWDILGSYTGQVSSVDVTRDYAMFNNQVGTGVDAGEVQIKMSGGGLTSADMYIDQIFVSYAVVTRTIGYANGSIWIDTINGTAGTVPYVNGTADKPVNSWGNALTLSADPEVNLNRFAIGNGSDISLTSNSDNFTLQGFGWSLDTNNQSCDGSYFSGANVSGVYTNTNRNTSFEKCRLNVVSGNAITAIECQLADSFYITDTGNYYFNDCVSAVAGTSSPNIDFGATIADSNVNFRRYAGGIRVYNCGVSGIDNMSLEGHGQLKIDDTCEGGTIALRGHFRVTDYASGVVGLSDDANFISTVIHAGTAKGAGNGFNQIKLADDASTVDGSYDPSTVFIIDGSGAGQTRSVYQYDGFTQTATVDRNWKIQPVADSTIYRILANPGREHVHEGLLASGSTTWAALNSLASSSDNAYNKQTLFFKGGNGEDQVSAVQSYDGATKIATLTHTLDVAVDGTTSYAMLPTHIHSPEDIASEVTASGTEAGFDSISDCTLAKQNTIISHLSTTSGNITSLNNVSIDTIVASGNAQSWNDVSPSGISLQEFKDYGLNRNVISRHTTPISASGRPSIVSVGPSGNSKGVILTSVDASGNLNTEYYEDI